MSSPRSGRRWSNFPAPSRANLTLRHRWPMSAVGYLERRRIDRGDAHFSRAAEQHVGPVRRRAAPAGECFRQRVIAGADILVRRPCVVAGAGNRVANRRRRRGRAGRGSPWPAPARRQAASMRVDRDRAEAVVAAIAGDHRGRGRGIDLARRPTPCCDRSSARPQDGGSRSPPAQAATIPAASTPSAARNAIDHSSSARTPPKPADYAPRAWPKDG